MNKDRFPARIARAVAEKLTEELGPTAEHVEIAGSLRRNKPLVHDIDVVILPSGDGGTFETGLANLVQRGSLTPVRDGDRIKAFVATKTGIPVDIYVASRETFPTLLLIRTGSKDHNIKLAMRARELGMKLRASGDGIEDVDGRLLRIGSEEEIFTLLRVPYAAPEQRG